MSNPTVQERLEYAAEKGSFPGSAADSATQILGRLKTPIRIVILGMPQSGKTAVLNLLVGQDLVPDGMQNLPTMQVESGTEPQMICTLPDGTQKTIPGTDLSALEAIKPAFVTVQADLPALSKISLLEVVASDKINEQRRAIAWACKRADVVIWCTENFNADEQNLWYEVPDHLKDHAFLLLTKTDLLAGQTIINIRLTELAKTAGEEFLRILPLSTKPALEIRASEAGFDLAAFKASGATALISAIKTQIDGSQRAALDHGEQILAKYCGDIDFSALNDAPQPDPVTSEASDPEMDAPAAEAEEPVVPEEEIQSDQAQPDTDRPILEEALAVVVACGADLIGVLDQPDEWSVDRILPLCDEAVADLLEILEEEPGPVLSRICLSAYDIQDNIMLMQSESGENRADNAITLVLQIRREIEAALV